MSTSSETLSYQPPHTLNTKEEAFVKQLTPKEQELHQLATQMLGSSYFAGKTHAYKAWDAKQKPSPK
jgi:hypothetical protein